MTARRIPRSHAAQAVDDELARTGRRDKCEATAFFEY
jgi:hypothetical protein